MIDKRKLLSALLVLSGCVTTLAQNVQLRLNNVSVRTAMTELKQKSGYSFVYEGTDINTTKKVNVNATTLRQAVD